MIKAMRSAGKACMLPPIILHLLCAVLLPCVSAVHACHLVLLDDEMPPASYPHHHPLII